jgi:hypothetical protein
VSCCVWPIGSGYDAVQTRAAIVLLVAAALKCHELATIPVIGNAWLDFRWLLMATVEFELFFGLWHVRRKRRGTRRSFRQANVR